MEKYFSTASKDYYQGKKLVDSHPENFYQVKNKLKIIERSHSGTYRKT